LIHFYKRKMKKIDKINICINKLTELLF